MIWINGHSPNLFRDGSCRQFAQTARAREAAQRKLTESQRRFDDPEHRLRHLLAQRVKRPACRRRQPMRPSPRPALDLAALPAPLGSARPTADEHKMAWLLQRCNGATHDPHRHHRRRLLPRHFLDAARGRASVARPSSGRPKCLIHIEAAVLDRLRAMRRAGESYINRPLSTPAAVVSRAFAAPDRQGEERLRVS